MPKARSAATSAGLTKFLQVSETCESACLNEKNRFMVVQIILNVSLL